MYFVYILQSLKDQSFYTGVTTNIKKRLNEHNRGDSTYSANIRPLILKWYCGFSDKTKAYTFERYLKRGSGMAFRNKHLL